MTFKGEVIDSWIDIRTEFGFIREYHKSKYYYVNNNNFVNSEIKFSQPKFPLLKKENHFNDRIGTVDLETYGSSFGLGYHKVYAGGWAIKGETNLFYKNKTETSEQLINRIFTSIFMKSFLTGYTFYIHNLGQFYSIFIIKSLVLNNDMIITPIWKENAII